VVASSGQRILAKAVDKFGVEELSLRLGLRPGVLRHYAEGRRPVPDAVLLKLFDVLRGPRER
jgi:hypothetical protein